MIKRKIGHLDTTMIVYPNNLEILKIKIKFEIYEFCQYLIISYVKVTGKFLMSFEKIFMYNHCFSKHRQ
jgi:hypothetical protein